MGFELTILGSSSATPIYDRHPTSQLLVFRDRHFLIDCGEGTQMQMLKYKIRYHRISHIFISHLHGDHYLGLIGCPPIIYKAAPPTYIFLVSKI